MELRNNPGMTVGDRILEARREKGWDRKTLAAESGVPYPTLAGLENGDQKTSTSIPALASALDVHALWLAENKGPKHFGATSQSARFSDDTMSQAVELLHLMADARPEDRKFRRLTWGMILIAAKGIERAKGDPRKAMAQILADLAKET
jgi:transcriptional regulator with XRE-family HTH domain